jgi:hypothetical protein
VQALFDTIRAQASRAAWSQGVELARSGAVQGERESATEIVLRVRPLAGVVHPTVLLFPEDEAWECDCGGEDDPCAHVAAAVIAVRAAKKDGQLLPAADPGSSGRRGEAGGEPAGRDGGARSFPPGGDAGRRDAHPLRQPEWPPLRLLQ